MYPLYNRGNHPPPSASPRPFGRAEERNRALDEELAAKHPYQQAYLPVARLEDGTLTSW